MYYYLEKIPKKDSIVIGIIKHDQETENNLYVELPEFNNIMGIIPKSEFPVKKKAYLKALKNTKAKELLTCKVMHEPKLDDTGTPRLIDLSIKNVDEKYNQSIINRYRNAEKIIKLIKYISKEFNLNFSDIIKDTKIQATILIPFILSEQLNEDDDTINDLKAVYEHYLEYCDEFVNMMNIEDERKVKIINNLKQIITEIDTYSDIIFDLSIWNSNNRDPVYSLRDLFTYILNLDIHKDKNIQIRYIGAPSYQLIISLNQREIKNIDNKYTSIFNEMHKYIVQQNIVGYDIKYNLSNKKIKNGEISISYPYKIL